MWQQVSSLCKSAIILWKRFLDDTEELKKKTHHTIKFTYDISNIELTFLDITVYKGDRFQTTNILDYNTHIKNTSKQLYVHSTSYHPPSTIKETAKEETKGT